MKSANLSGKLGGKVAPSSTSNSSKSGGNPNYPSKTGMPSGKGRGNTPKK